MLLIIVILLASLIIIPLVDLVANERIKYALKVAVYVLTFAYVLFVLVTGRALVV
jgi:hypothetical protein